MFLETSAKTVFNVVEAFNLSAQAILQNSEKTLNDNNTNKGNKLKIETKKNSGGCC